jgi:hypothetical protein
MNTDNCRFYLNGFGEKNMIRIVFASLILVLFVFTACGAPGVAEKDAQSAAEAQAVESGASTLPVVTVYKTPT